MPKSMRHYKSEKKSMNQNDMLKEIVWIESGQLYMMKIKCTVTRCLTYYNIFTNKDIVSDKSFNFR